MSTACSTWAEQFLRLLCQAWFAHGESILDFPNHLLNFSCDSPQEDFFSNSPRNQNITSLQKHLELGEICQVNNAHATANPWGISVVENLCQSHLPNLLDCLVKSRFHCWLLTCFLAVLRWAGSRAGFPHTLFSHTCECISICPCYYNVKSVLGLRKPLLLWLAEWLSDGPSPGVNHLIIKVPVLLFHISCPKWVGSQGFT